MTPMNDDTQLHEMAIQARAMLATCRRRMTGSEIRTCELLAQATGPAPESFTLTRDQIAWFHNMTVQFAKEIGDWINLTGATANQNQTHV